MLGTGELLVIGAVVLLMFGGKKIPEMMKGLGQGVRSFKDAVNAKDEGQKAEALPKEELKEEDEKTKE